MFSVEKIRSLRSPNSMAQIVKMEEIQRTTAIFPTSAVAAFRRLSENKQPTAEEPFWSDFLIVFVK